MIRSPSSIYFSGTLIPVGLRGAAKDHCCILESLNAICGGNIVLVNLSRSVTQNQDESLLLADILYRCGSWPSMREFLTKISTKQYVHICMS